MYNPRSIHGINDAGAIDQSLLESYAADLADRVEDETLACGTGACAAMVVCRRWGLVDDHVTVSLPGGDLQIAWTGDSSASVWMTGPAVTVFEGSVAL
jgi:diaminopimelate epimerase